MAALATDLVLGMESLLEFQKEFGSQIIEFRFGIDQQQHDFACFNWVVNGIYRTNNLIDSPTYLRTSNSNKRPCVPVSLGADLAGLYGVDTKVLNQAVKRNKDRFPFDFMFQLTADEKAEVVTNCDHLAKLKFSKSLPFAFTEHGAIQAANVLSSPEAVQMRNEIFYSDFLSSRSNRNGSNT
jgi:hypothetical protein